jgi:hypothetical protein
MFPLWSSAVIIPFPFKKHWLVLRIIQGVEEKFLRIPWQSSSDFCQQQFPTKRRMISVSWDWLKEWSEHQFLLNKLMMDSLNNDHPCHDSIFLVASWRDQIFGRNVQKMYPVMDTSWNRVRSYRILLAFESHLWLILQSWAHLEVIPWWGQRFYQFNWKNHISNSLWIILHHSSYDLWVYQFTYLWFGHVSKSLEHRRHSLLESVHFVFQKRVR